jgi:AraC-like DNA-binding protein
MLFPDCNVLETEKTQSVDMIRRLMAIEPHLSLMELVLPPAGEWTPDGRCWMVIRLAEGFGYCLHGGPARDLKAGDMVVTGPNSELIVRASQLGELRLEFFRVVPQRLNGLITVLEWRQLERVSTPAVPLVFHFAAHEALAQRFARLTTLPERDGLAGRSAMLQLWAACIAGVLPAVDESMARKKNLEAAFRRFISRISEKELATSTMADMAVQLNCSERHLSRLFRVEFGMSLREKQTELSLQRACQLLLDPGAKIRSIAYDTGYRHVGFFNTLFKKRFGLTPKEWRQQNPPAGTDDRNRGEAMSIQPEARLGHHADRSTAVSVERQPATATGVLNGPAAREPEARAGTTALRGAGRRAARRRHLK